MTVPISPIRPSVALAAGEILTALGQSSLGYPIAALGFFGMLVIIFMKNSMEKRVQMIEEQIISAAIELEELQKG